MYTISWYIVLFEWNKGMHLADDHNITGMPLVSTILAVLIYDV